MRLFENLTISFALNSFFMVLHYKLYNCIICIKYDNITFQDNV